MLYCFRYLTLQNICLFLKSISGDKLICDICWLTFFAHYYILWSKCNSNMKKVTSKKKSHEDIEKLYTKIKKKLRRNPMN